MKQNRKLLMILPALLLALLCAGGTRALAVYASDMEDVKESDYYYDAVRWALANDITTGTSATTFSPGSVCTRAQVMTFLHRAAGLPEAESGANPFYDVAESDYFRAAVLWAVEQGITNGVSPHYFAPNEPCTQEQILTFLHRAKGAPHVSADASGAVHDWAADAVAWARASGLLRNGASPLTAESTRGSTVYYLYESTKNYSDGAEPFEGYAPVALTGGVYDAPTTGAFVSAAMTLAEQYEHGVDPAGADERFASGRLIVRASRSLPDLTAYGAAQVVEGANGDVLVQFTRAADAAACAAYLAALPTVEYAEPDILMQMNDDGSGGSLSWGTDATGAAAYAADLVRRGVDTSIVVAVVDTGVDASHPFLSGRVVSGYDFVGRDAVADDKAGHGTHVAGTVVDCTPGTDIKIMPVCVLSSRGGYSTIIAQGIRYAADHGAQVINLSLGGGHSSYVDRAVAYALARGVTVVAAAGNENRNTAYVCPAHIRQVITVAAADSEGKRAGFSNYGAAVDLAAPGVGINSSVPGGYESWQGTSMAAPHVSAASALLLCEQRGLLPTTVERRLKAAAREAGSAAYYGAGLLDLTPFLHPETPENAALEGVCGPDVAWMLDGDMLTLLGTGPMYDYADETQVPWAAWRGSIRALRMDTRITSIGAYAFAGCTGLPALTIMDSLSSIGAHAFDGSGIATLSIRGSVNSIGEGAFANCRSLTAALFSGIVGRIGANAFAGCTALRDVYVTGLVYYVDPSAFPTLQ